MVGKCNVVRISTKSYYTIRYIIPCVVKLYRNDQKPNHKLEMNYIKILNNMLNLNRFIIEKPLLKLEYCKYKVII